MAEYKFTTKCNLEGNRLRGKLASGLTTILGVEQGDVIEFTVTKNGRNASVTGSRVLKAGSKAANEAQEVSLATSKEINEAKAKRQGNAVNEEPKAVPAKKAPAKSQASVKTATETPVKTASVPAKTATKTVAQKSKANVPVKTATEIVKTKTKTKTQVPVEKGGKVIKKVKK